MTHSANDESNRDTIGNVLGSNSSELLNENVSNSPKAAGEREAEEGKFSNGSPLPSPSANGQTPFAPPRTPPTPYVIPPQPLVSQPSTKAGVMVATALIAALLGGGTVATFGHNNSPRIVQESVTQNITGGVNWNGTAKTVANSVVTLDVTSSSENGEGSGVVIDDAGTIVTNNHVVAAGGSDRVIKAVIGNKAYTVKVIGTDATSDLAVVKLVGKTEVPLVPIKFADSDKVQVGENVMAVGSPLGLQGTVTTGIISALKRPVVTTQRTATNNKSDYVVTNALQTSAPINPGNSGGALVNVNGELVGINSSIATLSQSSASGAQSGSIGIGFAIPSNHVKNIIEQIMKHGKVEHAYLGITSTDAIISTAADKNTGILGVKLETVANGSPAAKAGLKVGDTITKYNGEAITSKEALVAAVREARPNDKAKFSIITSKGLPKDVDVTLGAIPAE